MWFAVENLCQQTLRPAAPWEFKLTQEIPLQIREDKQSRQDWYRNTSTVHQFYTPYEPVCNTQRPSASNEVFLMHGLPPDFDAKIPEGRVKEVVAAMKIKPSWIERSLGGGVRLIWLFAEPLKVYNTKFCEVLIRRLWKAFNLDMLPALDEGALIDPNRLLCNGGVWESTGAPSVPMTELQFHLVETARSYNFQGGEYNNIPLDVVEAELKKRFPNYDWPGEFRVGSQGPTFWIAESTSPLSAVVKETGIYTFSAHAPQTFYKWTDLLGAEFCEGYRKETFTKATEDIYFCSESNHFWYVQDWKGHFHSAKRDQLTGHLKCNIGISTKPGDRGSDLERAVAYIQQHKGIVGAGPFLFNPNKVVRYNGGVYLNVAHKLRCMQPTPGKHEWGPNGDFPYWSGIIDHLFDPIEIQKDHFLAWWRLMYQAAFEQKFVPGQSIFMAGCTGSGKTCTGQVGVGKSMGGHFDASSWFTGNNSFGSEMYDFAIWCSDDTIIAANEYSMQTFHAMVKRLSANQSHVYHKKFHSPFMIECMSRAIITLNLDTNSARLLPPLDNSSAEKINVYRCVVDKENVWNGLLSHKDGAPILERELPNLCGWLLNTSTDRSWTTGKDATRYGIISYHEPSLVKSAQHSTKASDFGDVIDKVLVLFFQDHPSETHWSGTSTDLINLVSRDPANDFFLRSFKVETIGKDLENCRKYGQLKFDTAYNSRNRKVFIFLREHYTDLSDGSTDNPALPPDEGCDFRR